MILTLTFRWYTTATFATDGNSHSLIGFLLIRSRPSEMDLILLVVIKMCKILTTLLTDLQFALKSAALVMVKVGSTADNFLFNYFL